MACFWQGSVKPFFPAMRASKVQRKPNFLMSQALSRVRKAQKTNGRTKIVWKFCSWVVPSGIHDLKCPSRKHFLTNQPTNSPRRNAWANNVPKWSFIRRQLKGDHNESFKLSYYLMNQPQKPRAKTRAAKRVKRTQGRSKLRWVSQKVTKWLFYLVIVVCG